MQLIVHGSTILHATRPNATQYSDTYSPYVGRPSVSAINLCMLVQLVRSHLHWRHQF